MPGRPSRTWPSPRHRLPAFTTGVVEARHRVTFQGAAFAPMRSAPTRSKRRGAPRGSFTMLTRRPGVLALVVAVCWTVNSVVIDVDFESSPRLLFAALRFALVAFRAVFFVPRPIVRWRLIVTVRLFIRVGQFGCLLPRRSTPSGARHGVSRTGS